MAQFPRSIRANIPPDATAAQKSLFTGLLAANGVPTQGDMSFGLPLGNFADIDLVLVETAGGTYDANVWWGYPDADGAWVLDAGIVPVSVAANGQARVVLQQSAASRVYVEVFGFAGAADATATIIGRGSLDRGR